MNHHFNKLTPAEAERLAILDCVAAVAIAVIGGCACVSAWFVAAVGAGLIAAATWRGMMLGWGLIP